MQVIGNVSILHLRRESDYLVRKGINILGYLSEDTTHYFHKFFLGDFFLAAYSTNKTDGDEFSFASLVNVMKVSPLYRESLRDNSYELLKHEPVFTDGHLHSLRVAVGVK